MERTTMSKIRRYGAHAAPRTNGAPSEKAVIKTAKPNQTTQSTGRLVSLDALRGFNMFWIIGGAELFAAVAKYINHPWLNAVSQNLTEHVEWQGFHFHDM